QEADAYIQTLIADSELFIQFLDKFISQSTAVAMEDKVARIKNKLSIRSLAAIWDINQLVSRLDSMDEKLLSTEQRQIVSVAKNSIDRFRKSGLSPDQYDNVPDFED